MAQPLSTLQPDVAAPRLQRWLRPALLWGATSLVTILLLATFALWFRYGTTVFFEMIAAGFAACF
jgi:hypothetical protein